jgi:hypothetical protein
MPYMSPLLGPVTPHPSRVTTVAVTDLAPPPQDSDLEAHGVPVPRDRLGGLGW